MTTTECDDLAVALCDALFGINQLKIRLFNNQGKQAVVV